MISPGEIRDKARRAYTRLLAAWAKGRLDEFFPYRIPANLAPVAGDLSATIQAVELLRASAKAVTGAGYSVHWSDIASRDFGRNRFPARLTIDTCEDFLALAGKQRHFRDTCQVAAQIRTQLPQLEDWVAANVRRLADLAEIVEGLIQVTQYFLAHPWPDCYARQIPVAVDTKFVERHQSILAEWLNELLPASAIQVDEAKFALRFGLRDGQPHMTVRTLDPQLQQEIGLPWEELSLPLRSLKSLAVREARILIVENRLNLLTLPLVSRGLAIHGEGKAVTRLRNLPWLRENELYYWGDLDVEGFQILSSLRAFFPAIRSLLMDECVLRDHADRVLAGSGAGGSPPSLLTLSEQRAFLACRDRNLRLEQEHLPQRYVDAAILEALAFMPTA